MISLVDDPECQRKLKLPIVVLPIKGLFQHSFNPNSSFQNLFDFYSVEESFALIALREIQQNEPISINFGNKSTLIR